MILGIDGKPNDSYSRGVDYPDLALKAKQVAEIIEWVENLTFCVRLWQLQNIRRIKRLYRRHPRRFWVLYRSRISRTGTSDSGPWRESSSQNPALR